MELLRNAFSGWQQFVSAGKLGAALLLVIVLFWGLGLGKKLFREMFLFGTVMTIVCIFPATAAVIMLWQTRFYDYQWIWTVVPMTGMIACGSVLLLERIWNGKEGKLQKILITAMIAGLLFLCGRLGNQEWEVRDLSKERKEIAAVLESLHGDADEEICLLAPKEVIAQARSLDASIRLLYGRNMWQGGLNAFSYDTYDQDRRDLYVWMIMIGRYGTLDVPVATDIDVIGDRLEPGSHLEGLDCVRKALKLGVNRILLPGNMSEESLETLRRELSAEVIQVGDYWLVTVPDGIARAEAEEGLR